MTEMKALRYEMNKDFPYNINIGNNNNSNSDNCIRMAIY